MAWRLAKGLEKLRAQINAVAPRRNKASDGSVGDLRHSSRASDHNPNAAGVVTAIDVTNDVANGCDGHALSRSLTSDPRTKYIIFNSEIWKARTGKWERYTGPSAHKHHVHISIKPDVYDDISPWQLSGSPVAEVAPEKPVLKLGDKNQAVRILQAALGIPVDGNFGFGTQKAVQRFQESKGLIADGKVGPATWVELGK